MAKFTKDDLNLARSEGYTDAEIASYIASQDDEVRNALEEGYSIDEIADYLATGKAPQKALAQQQAPQSEQAPQEEYATSQNDPSLSQIATGMAADIAVAEGAKYAGAASGAYLGTLGGPAAPVTVPAASAAGYVIGALGGGWTGSVLAQKIEGADSIDYGRATIDTILNLIPASKIGKSGTALAEISGRVAKRPILTGIATGAVATPTYMAVEEAQDKKEYTLDDYLKRTGATMALGAGLGAGEKIISKGILKIRNKTPSEINNLIATGDRSTIELVNHLTAGVTPQEYRANPANVKDVTEYIRNAMGKAKASFAPSRVVGEEITNVAKRAKAGAEAVEGTAMNIGKQIDSYLEANPQYRDDAIKYLDGEDAPNLPPDLLEKLSFGRSKIRAEQQRMLDLHNSGESPLTDAQADVIAESLNRGDYLRRSYEFFENPNYTPSKEKYDALKKSLTTGPDKISEDEANKYLAELQMKMKGNPTEFEAFMLGPGSAKVFKQRKDVSKELEDYLGFIKEPGRRVSTTMSVLNRINEYSESDAKISRLLLDSGAAVKASDPNFAQGLQPLNLKRGKAMVNGEEVYVDPNVQTALNKIYAGKADEASNSAAVRAMSDVYEAAVSGLKATKVLGNIPSYLIQFPSNIAIVLSAGMNPLKGLGAATRASLGTLSGTKLGDMPFLRQVANQAPPMTLQEFEDRRRRGMITGNVDYEDMKAGMQGKRVGRAFQKVADVPGRIYSIPDNLLRNVHYENNIDVLKKIMPTATEEQVKDMAARWTTKTYPNYESLSPEVKMLSRKGLMPQFVNYTLEAARSQIEQAKLIKAMRDGTFVAKLGDEFKNIPVDQDALRKEAANRLGAMVTAYAAASYGLNQFNRQSLTEEQERAYRETVVPEYERDKPLFIKKNKDGTFTSMNASYYLPHTIVSNPVMSILRGENTEESTENILKLLNTELVGEGTFAGRELYTLAFGRDLETGKRISNDPTMLGQTKDRVANLAKEFTPATVTALQQKDKPLSDRLIRQAGVRFDKRTIAEGFGIKANQINEAVNNIKSTLSGKQYQVDSGKISPEEYQAFVVDEQKNYAANMDMMIRHVQNLRTLGETDETIIPVLKKAKFSSSDMLNILEGKNVPYDPARKKTTSEMLDEVTGNTNAETERNIRAYIKKDPIVGKRILSAYKEQRRTDGIVLSPRESLLAGLPTIEKVDRLFPEIEASSNPDAAIRRLVKKKVLTPTDVQAIKLRQRANAK